MEIALRGLLRRNLPTSGVISLIVVCFCQLMKPTSTATTNAELSANSVNVALYLIPVSEWNGGIKSKFETAVAKEANSYCSTNAGGCGLTSWSGQFSSSDVDYVSDPEYSKPNLAFQYGLKYPTGVSPVAGGTTTYLPKSALETIAIKVRTTLSSEANVDIALIGTTNYGPVPDPLINAVISVVMLVLVIALLITICVLKAKCSDDYEHLEEPVKTSPKNDVEKADEKKKAKVPKEDRYEKHAPRILTPVMRITPEPVTVKSIQTPDDPKMYEETQNGATPAVTVVNQDGPEVIQVTS